MATYRVHVIGAEATGKTAFIERVVYGRPPVKYRPGSVSGTVRYYTTIGIVKFELTESRDEVPEDVDAFLVVYKSYETLKYARELCKKLPKDKKIIFVETHEDLNVHQRRLGKMIRIVRRLGYTTLQISTKTCKRMEKPLLAVMGGGVNYAEPWDE